MAGEDNNVNVRSVGLGENFFKSRATKYSEAILIPVRMTHKRRIAITLHKFSEI